MRQEKKGKLAETSPDIKSTLTEQAEELDGTLSFQNLDDKLMHSVLDADEESVEDAKILEQSEQSQGSFHPDMMMQQLVQNYSLAKDLYGETMLRLLSSYNPGYIEKNIRIPEFQKDLKQKLDKKFQDLKEKDLIDASGAATKKGRELATLQLFVEELDHLQPRGMRGERAHKKKHVYGDKEDVRNYKKGDHFADIDMKKSVHQALRRGRSELVIEDLKSSDRVSKGSVYVIYGMDASGSMKGKKLEAAKRAGIALSYKAIQERDMVGLVVFESEIKESVAPTNNFPLLFSHISRIRATKQTDMVAMIRESINLFPEKSGITKHLIMLTDAMPTVGDDPEQRTLAAVEEAQANGITISVIGLGIENKGAELARKIAAIGKGKFHQVRNLENVDTIVLEDYYDVY